MSWSAASNHDITAQQLLHLHQYLIKLHNTAGVLHEKCLHKFPAFLEYSVQVLYFQQTFARFKRAWNKLQITIKMIMGILDLKCDSYSKKRAACTHPWLPPPTTTICVVHGTIQDKKNICHSPFTTMESFPKLRAEVTHLSVWTVSWIPRMMFVRLKDDFPSL